MRIAYRATLAVSLLAGVYVLAAGIAAGLVWFGLWYRQLALESGVDTATSLAFLILSAAAAIALLLGLFARPPRRTPTEPGVVLTAERHPRLWSELRELGEVIGTRPPDQVRLIPAVTASVSDSSKLLGLRKGTRTLYIGAPLLLGFTRQQLRSVLAHELGHYSGRHTTLGGVTYRGEEALGNLVLRFGRRSAIGRVFYLYARLYVRVSFAVRRQQELEADDFSVRVAGRDAAVSAMCELSVVEAAWDHYFEQFVNLVHEAGKRPTDFFAGFVQVLRAPQLQDALATFRSDFDEPPAGKYDSHPPLSQRVARFRAMPEDRVPDDPTPASELVDEVEEAIGQLEEWMYAGTKLEALPWHVLLRGIESPRIRSRAELCYTAAKQVEHSEVSLGTLVGSVRGRRLASYVRPLLDEPTGENIAATGRDLLVSAVEEALMTVAGARLALGWDETPVLLDAQGRVIDSAGAVEAALEAGSPAVLTSWLEERGVHLDHVPALPVVDVRDELRESPPRVLEALAPVAGSRTLFLVVLTHGVLLRRASGGDLFAWWTGGSDPGRILLRRVTGFDAADLLADERSTWLPWDEIVSVSVARSLTRRPKLVITATDQRSYTVKFRMHTRDTGSSIETLHFFLDDRLAARPPSRFRAWQVAH